MAALQRAAERFEAADNALVAAGHAGPDALAAVRAEREEALTEWYVLKQRLADWWLAGLRAAVEMHPGVVLTHLRDELELDDLAEAIVGRSQEGAP